MQIYSFSSPISHGRKTLLALSTLFSTPVVHTTSTSSIFMDVYRHFARRVQLQQLLTQPLTPMHCRHEHSHVYTQMSLGLKRYVYRISNDIIYQ